MIWIILICSIFVLSLLFYIFYPSLKAKKVFNQSNIEAKENINFSKINENFENENKKEDPDTKIDYENFDLGGLFEEDDDEQTDNDIENAEIEEEDNNPYSEKFEEFFNRYIGNKEEKRKERYNPFGIRNNEWEDDEINELLRENFSERSVEDLSKQFNDLSHEMKVLILSNFLDRKE